MINDLTTLVQLQIEKGGQEEEIQALTFKLIDSKDFDVFPEQIQDAIYQLNMNDVNQLRPNEYSAMLKTLKGFGQ